MSPGITRLLLAAGVIALTGDVFAGEIFEHTDSASGTQVFVLKQGDVVAKFAPSKGANVFSIEVAGIEYLRTPADMYTFQGSEHGVPILYPTPNRVSDARFRYGGKEYLMEPNFGPHRIHGLLIGQPWQVISTGTTESTAVIQSAIEFNPGTGLYRQFPFEHRLLLTVTVTSDAVRWAYEVDNRQGAAVVPFGFGLHPYFVYQGTRDQTFITLPATHQMEAKNAIPSGRLIGAEELDFPLGEPFPVRDRKFDDVFLGMPAVEPAVIDFRDRNRQVKLSASPEFTHIVLWTTGLPVFSVENQTSSTDAHNLSDAGFESEAHLQTCGPGETCTGWAEYRFTAAGDSGGIWEDPAFLLSQERCASCHGIAFTGARAPNLLNGYPRFAKSEAEMARVISEGIPGTEMPAFEGDLTDEQIAGVAGFMDSLIRVGPTEELQNSLDVTGAGPRQSFLETFALETVVDGLDTPWSFAFLPEGGIILNEKPGRVRLYENGVLGEPVRGTPAVAYRQDGGLLAVALHPDYDENGWVYLGFADPGEDPGVSTTKIVRGRIQAGAWVDEQTIWSAPQSLYSDNNSHFGTRLLFEGDYLFFSIGDRGQREIAQSLSSPFGKIHRVYADGAIPRDNPFTGKENALATIWTYGHRNPQGLAMSPGGTLWASEHGPRGGDELNRIEAGGNYGWPLATSGKDFDGTDISPHTSLPGMTGPELVWAETIAPSNIGFYSGERFPGWQGSLLVTSMAAQELRRVAVENDAVVSQELLLRSIGRIRDVQNGPDGYPYLAVERPRGQGSILRLIPATLSDISLFEMKPD